MIRPIKTAATILLTLALAISAYGCSDDNEADSASSNKPATSNTSGNAFIGVWAGVWAPVVKDDDDYDDYDDYFDEDFEVFEIIFFDDGMFVTNEEPEYMGPASGTYSTADELLKLSDGWHCIYAYRFMSGALTLTNSDQTIVLTKKTASESLIVFGDE